MITQGGHLVGPAIRGDVDDGKDWVCEVQSLWPPRVIPIEDGVVVVKLPFHSDDDVKKSVGGRRKGKLVEILVSGGGAFGTGEHPTTRMCSAWGYKVVKELLKKKGRNAEVCDYGAGTGLIGLICLAAGERVRVKGVEVDHLAIIAGRENGDLNGYGRELFEMYAPPLGAAGGELWESLTGVDTVDPVAMEVERYNGGGEGSDVVLANILAGPLKQLAPTIWGLTKVGGKVGLSGIVAESQAEGVMEEYRKVGFKDVRVEEVEGIWAFITMLKKAAGGGRLEGVKLKDIVETLVKEIGWGELQSLTGIRAFGVEGKPSIKSALKFLRTKDHEWARKKIEELYLDMFH